MAAVAGGSRKRAYAVSWRNFQSKKNKTWERCVSSLAVILFGRGVRTKRPFCRVMDCPKQRVRWKTDSNLRWLGVMISPIQRRGTYASRHKSVRVPHAC